MLVRPESPKHDRESRRSAKATAFTLAELLVVITIIGILLALLLPAIQGSRESARRSQCNNSIRQIGIALQNYHNFFRSFPSGSHLHTEEDFPSISWRVMILPFLEETSIYDKIGPTVDGGATDWNPRTYIVSQYYCPSVPDEEKYASGGNHSQYSGVMGAGRDDYRIDLEDARCGDVATDGIFYPGSRTKIAKITDGTSHTLAVGEQNYTFLHWMVGCSWYGDPPSEMCMDATRNIRYPINADLSQVGYYVFDPTAPAGAPKTMLHNELLFGSYHPGVAQFCLADGSVQMFTETIDFTVFQDMATIGGGEVNEGFR